MELNATKKESWPKSVSFNFPEKNYFTILLLISIQGELAEKQNGEEF